MQSCTVNAKGVRQCPNQIKLALRREFKAELYTLVVILLASSIPSKRLVLHGDFRKNNS